MKKYHYTYYSYEEFGRGYIGKRSCDCKPEEDVEYFGSYTDQVFKPTQKIILGTYDTEKELAKAEEILHAFYDVKNNPHFSNKHNAEENFYFTSEELSLFGKKGGKIRKQQLIEEGFYSTKKQSIRGKKGGRKLVNLGLGIHGMSKEELSKAGKKGGEINKKNKTGICGLTKDQRSKTTTKTNLQKWQCTKTGFITNAGCLSQYQKKKGIDTSHRIRIH